MIDFLINYFFGTCGDTDFPRGGTMA